MKTTKYFCLLFFIFFFLSGCVNASAYYVTYNNIKYSYNDRAILKELVEEQVAIMDAANQMAEAARQLGYAEDHDIILLAKSDWEEANNIKLGYEKVLENLERHWKQKEEEYPAATYTWEYLKSLGYNDYVCAGIMGNLMAEVGGQTLDLDYELTHSGYYGICQWGKHYEEVWGTSLEEQCVFLGNTIEYEFNVFGYLYEDDFKYDDFLKLNSSSKAALAFAKCYERCSSATYKVRQKNANEAYEYYTS